MKVVVLGGAGQLGLSLQAIKPAEIEGVFCGSKDCDITDEVALKATITADTQWVINAAAYTNVDGAESDTKNAYRINDEAAGLVARICAQKNIPLIHISTDFVFDGLGSNPYGVDDKTAPLGVYGASKLAGEERVLRASSSHCVVRTSWLYSPWKSNFVKTMIRLMATRDTIGVVDDELGSPTSALSLAAFLWSLVGIEEGCVAPAPLMHYCDKGEVSRYDFAKAIYRAASEEGILTNTVHINAIKAADMALPAQRPSYSTLKCVVETNPPWYEELLRLFRLYRADW